MSRSRRARAGCLCARRCARRAPPRISPSRSRRARCGARSGAPRPTARTRAGCGRCSARAGCRRPGSRPRTCASGAPAARLRKTLVDERTTWLQRVQATLFHHGVSGAPDKLLSAAGPRVPRRARAARRGQRADRGGAADDRGARPPARPARAELRRLARRQTGCRALMAHYGIGELTAPTILCELGDVTRLSASRKAVRCAGLDIGVHRSDRRSRAGQADQAGLAAAALGALRVSPSGLPAHEPRPRRLPGAQGARALAHPGVADDRPQARPALLPHPARARPRRPRTRHLTLRRPVPPSPPLPDDSQSSGQLPQLSRLPPTGGGPPKTERPESFPADRPIDHHVAGHKAEHPDKPGRPRNDRNHTTPQPLAPDDLTEAPVQISSKRSIFVILVCGCALRRWLACPVCRRAGPRTARAERHGPSGCGRSA